MRGNAPNDNLPHRQPCHRPSHQIQHQRHRTYNKETRTFEDSDEKLVLQFTIYGALAENFARSVKRGERIMICGDLVTQEFEQDGIKRSVTVIKPVKDVGASMLFGTTTFTRGARP